MDKHILVFHEEDGEEKVTLKFELTGEYTIYTLHRLCKQYALASGFTQKSVEEAFGETVYDY